MSGKPLRLTDWKRILFGDAPAAFGLEVLFRAALVYVALLVILRLLGKRMTGQLTILEMAVTISLGAIVSLPMQSRDQGVALAIVLLFTALLMQRGLARMGYERRGFELVANGDVSPLVKDGAILVDELRRAALSRQQLFGLLREKGVRNLGEIKRVYLEASGDMSIFRRAKPEAGLCILPPTDEEIVARRPAQEGWLACSGCGRVAGQEQAKKTCAACGGAAWVAAVR